jgi:hypothetical protein
MAPVSAHWLIGSWPAAIDAQVPTVPVRLQAWQVAEQPVLQHTPCWQKLEAHSLPCTQAAPSCFLAQMVPLQTLPAVQSVLLPHLVRQTPAVPQT